MNLTDTNRSIDDLNSLLLADPGNYDLLVARGRAFWALGRTKEAINDWLRADSFSPDGPAARLIETARDILAFRNNDLYNP